MRSYIRAHTLLRACASLRSSSRRDRADSATIKGRRTFPAKLNREEKKRARVPSRVASSLRRGSSAGRLEVSLCRSPMKAVV